MSEINGNLLQILMEHLIEMLHHNNDDMSLLADGNDHTLSRSHGHRVRLVRLHIHVFQ